VQVFVSLGSRATPVQRAACDSALAAVAGLGLTPRRLADDERSNGDPLPAILRIVDECQGMLVLAHARHTRGDERLPTVWNHIEAAFAVARGQPILAVCEEGLKEEGLLEGGYGWPVFRTPFTPEAFAAPPFAAALQAFRERVLSHAAPRKGGMAGARGGRQ
jgi:hypothetical protein